MLTKHEHATYDALERCAKKGNPTAKKALTAVDTSRKAFFTSAKRVGTTAELGLIEEGLAQAAVASNPWLAIAVNQQ